MTPRLEILSKNRNLVGEYKFNHDRTSYLAHEPFYKEIYPTSKNIPEASPRVVTLSAHKNASYEYQYDRDLPTKASETSEASARVGELARSKTELWEKKGGWPNTKMFYEVLPQPVSQSARKAVATPRVEALAEHKKVPATFRPERPVRWDIEEQALTVNASLRVCQLARPKSRSMIKDDGWDPYIVSKAARYAQITPRVEELAAPLPRKQRSKKVI
ncbi:THEG [Bugula neritina]|uniref:THEG n=1 Tax=Bugula neritina TaxID=10212 RepID=A0A7J7K0W5_BUGNE|nr:THEG [Bugula neritina]